MAKAFMAYPELRSPFEATQIHPEGSATVLYQGKTSHTFRNRQWRRTFD